MTDQMIFNNLPIELTQLVGFYLDIPNLVKFSRMNNKLDNNIRKNKKFLQDLGHQRLTEHDDRLLRKNIIKEIYQVTRSIDLKYAIREGYLAIIKKSNYKKWQTAIEEACDGGYLDIVKYLLNKTESSQKGKGNLYEYLWNAARGGNLDIVEYLILQGADVHVQNDEILRIAAVNGHLDIVSYLLAFLSSTQNISARQKAFEGAIDHNHLDVAKYLMSPDIDISAYRNHVSWVRGMYKYLISCFRERNIDITDELNEAFTTALINNRCDVIDYLLTLNIDFNLQQKLDDMLHISSAETMDKLISMGLDVRAGDDKLLIDAASVNNLELIKYLLCRKANIHAQGDIILLKAMRYRDEEHYCDDELFKYLVEQGANIHVQDDEVFINATRFNKDLIEYLLEHGANINAQDGRALIEAYCGRNEPNLDMIKYLLEHVPSRPGGPRADIHARDDQILVLAATDGNLEFVKYLVSKGANVQVLHNYRIKHLPTREYIPLKDYLQSFGVNIHK